MMPTIFEFSDIDIRPLYQKLDGRTFYIILFVDLAHAAVNMYFNKLTDPLHSDKIHVMTHDEGAE